MKKESELPHWGHLICNNDIPHVAGYVFDGEDTGAMIGRIKNHVGKVDSVLDVGCGPGRSMRFFKDAGFSVVKGIDGDPQVMELPGLSGMTDDVKIHDLERSMYDSGSKFDIVWSYEVAEHVANHNNYILTLTANCGKYIFMTCSLCTGNRFHVNCQHSEFWIVRMMTRGFRFMNRMTDAFRELDTSGNRFFKETGMVFERVSPVSHNM